MIDLMTVHDHCEPCHDCSACPYERICCSLVEAAYQLKKLTAQLDRLSMEDVDRNTVMRVDLALKDLFQAMGGV